MTKPSLVFTALLVLFLILSGCFSPYDDSDRIMTSDKEVSKEDLARVTSYLLDVVPYVRAEQARLAQEAKKVKLVINVLSAPEGNFTKGDAGYMGQENYYEVYVSYSDKETIGPLKYDTYRVHSDLVDVYFYDNKTDDFVKVSQQK